MMHQFAYFILVFLILLSGCVSAPKLNSDLIQPWTSNLEGELEGIKPIIARYKFGNYELFYLAAHHSSDPKSETLKLVDNLFRYFDFNFLIIEPIPNNEGINSKWFIEEAKKGISDSLVVGGESSLAVVKAEFKNIPFAGGEIDHKTMYLQLRQLGFSIEDIFGFYLVRQIPEWIRDKAAKRNLIKIRGPIFILDYCKIFALRAEECPSFEAISNWYERNTRKKLSSDINNEETAPLSDSNLITHRISSAVGSIRDRFTLGLIQKYLNEYKKIAVIYGGSHYTTLKKSLNTGLGQPVEVITVDGIKK